MSSPPLRVALPGDIKETCRLCAKPLVISLENPQRRCAACGEVNLPAPEFTQPSAPPLRVPALFRLFLRGATGPLVAGVLASISASTPRGFSTLEWMVALPIIGLPLSLLTASWFAWSVSRPTMRGQRLAATAAWVGGWLTTVIVVVAALASGLVGWLLH